MYSCTYSYIIVLACIMNLAAPSGCESWCSLPPVTEEPSNEEPGKDEPGYFLTDINGGGD